MLVCSPLFGAGIIAGMVRVGLPDSTPQDLLAEFPRGRVEIVLLPDDLDLDTQVEFWVLPMFGRSAKQMFTHLNGVKVVQSMLAGVDRIVPWLPKGIVLCDGQGIHNTPVAEWVVAAILSALKLFPEYRDRQRERLWDGQLSNAEIPGKRPSQHAGAVCELPYRILGEELATKRVLIVGYGGIGAEVERLLAAFDVEILRVARTAKPGISAIEDLARLLPDSDIVVLLVPLTNETHRMMNAQTLGQMKHGAILVNAARGPVVDTDALVTQLHTGRIQAVLDVTDPEPLPRDHPLWSAPNCFITPHVAASVAQYATRGYRFAAAQIRRYLAGEPLLNQVKELGY
jgi:phosphoglycerate dehydrogenase-like enzyme